MVGEHVVGLDVLRRHILAPGARLEDLDVAAAAAARAPFVAIIPLRPVLDVVAHVRPLLLSAVGEDFGGILADDHRVRDEERVLARSAVGGLLRLELIEADGDVEDHPLAHASLVLTVERERALAELESHREAAVLGEVRLELRRLAADAREDGGGDGGELRIGLERTDRLLLQLEQQLVVALVLLCGVDDVRAANVGAVRLVPSADGARDGAVVELVPIRVRGGLEVVLAAALDDGRVARLDQLRRELHAELGGRAERLLSLVGELVMRDCNLLVHNRLEACDELLLYEHRREDRRALRVPELDVILDREQISNRRRELDLLDSTLPDERTTPPCGQVAERALLVEGGDDATSV